MTETTTSRLSFAATTVKRLATPARGKLFGTLFDGVSTELIPTHAYFFDGAGGTRPVSLKDIETFEYWNSAGGGSFDLQVRTAVRGSMTVSGHYGALNTPANWISGSFDIGALVQRGIFYSAVRLFENLVLFTEANYAFVSTGTGGGVGLQCLPSFDPWINVLGEEYVNLLGRERLLALDVYQKHEDNAGRIWLQMSEMPEQMNLSEMKDRVRRVVDGLEAPGVFCREPRTERERLTGVDPNEYRTPHFDWSELRDSDPYSPRWGGSGIMVGRTTFDTSLGFGNHIVHKRDLMLVLNTMIAIAIDLKNTIDPFGVALTMDGELIRTGCRDARQWTLQERADTVTEGLVQLSQQRSLKATGICLFGKGQVPGQSRETTAFKMYLESTTGDAYIVYVPFEDKSRKREYGTLVVEPDVPTIFASSH